MQQRADLPRAIASGRRQVGHRQQEKDDPELHRWNAKPPGKGLPMRLKVEAKSLRARNESRLHLATMPAPLNERSFSGA
jgi:hypothetical protein